VKPGEVRPLTIDGITDWVEIIGLKQGSLVRVRFRSGSELKVQASLLGEATKAAKP
jgi:hypothetical protein